MTADVQRDSPGCEFCGDRSILPEDAAHRAECSRLASARKTAAQVSDLPPVAVDDLFAHLVTPRAGGAVCTPESAVEVIRYVTALGWRPAVGRWAAASLRDRAAALDPSGAAEGAGR